MGAIDIGKMTIKPFNFYEIKEIEIEKKLNDHSVMFVKGIVKDVEGFSPVDTMTRGTSVQCINNGKVYFIGILQSVKIIKTSGDQHYLEIHAISNTILLDTVKHKRSFQNNGQSFQEIVESVISENSGKVTYHADVMNVEHIILQYNETDWEFVKRLASHTQDVLIPITDETPAFHFGVSDESGGTLNTRSYSKYKDFNILRKMSDELEPLTEEDIMLCSVETDTLICDLGEKLIVNGEELYVCHISITINEKSASLRVNYTLGSKKSISDPKYYNKATTGLVLNGEVLDLKGDTLQLKFYVYDKHHSDVKVYIDDDQSTGNEHFFKYATGYSAENHTGWYVMPEVGDVVQLFFPNEDERSAYAISSIRQDGMERTEDHLQKFLRTPFGKEIKFDQNKILITAKDSTTFIRITESSGIEIMTPDPIRVTSKDSTIDVTAGSDINVLAHANMNVTVRGNATVLVEGDSDTTVKGNATVLVEGDSDTNVKGDATVLVEGNSDTTVKGDATVSVEGNSDTAVKGNATISVDGNTTTTVKGDALVSVSGNVTSSIKGNAAMTVSKNTTISSTENIAISAGKNIAISAGDSIAINCPGNSINLVPDSGISVSTEEEFTLSSGKNTSFDSKEVIQIKSGKDSKIDSGEGVDIQSGKDTKINASAKLEVSSSSGAKIVDGGSSIKLESSGIDIKGSSVKIN